MLGMKSEIREKMNFGKELILVKVISAFSKSLQLFCLRFIFIYGVISLVPDISAHPAHKQRSCNTMAMIFLKATRLNTKRSRPNYNQIKVSFFLIKVVIKGHLVHLEDFIVLSPNREKSLPNREGATRGTSLCSSAWRRSETGNRG